MFETTPGSGQDKLAEFIVNDVFKWFKDERNAQLEPTWRRSYDAFRGRYDSDSLKRWRATEGRGWRSRVFVRLTKQKVLTGFNHVMSVALQRGRIPWSLEPSPLPAGPMGMPLSAADARARCDLMKKQISADFVFSKADQVFLGSGLECALYGHSWLEGPVVRSHKRMAVRFGVPGAGSMAFSPDIQRQYGRHTMSIETKLKPMVENPGVWSVFWDLETADHQKGQGVCVREMMSKGRFLDLREQPGYNPAAIDAVAAQFDTERWDESTEEDDSQGPVRDRFNQRKRVIAVFRYRGRVPRKYLERREAPGLADLSRQDGREVEVYCVCAQGNKPVVIRPPVINPLPYRLIYRAKWEDLPNEAGGVGIPENMQDSQMVINGLTRAMLDNKALSANILMGWNPRALAPGQNKVLYPGKAFEVSDAVDDVRKGIDFFSPPDNTRNTPALLEMFRQFADEETGLSRMMEGAVGPKNRTAFEMAQMVEAGNKIVGGTIRNLDEGQIEPLVRAFYHWHMLTNPREDIKGDYTPEARGFQSYVDQSKRAQDVFALFNLALSSELTARFTKVLPFLRELARIRDLDPDEFFPSDTELQQRSEGLAALLPQMANQPGNQPGNVGDQQGALPELEAAARQQGVAA